MAWTNRLPRTEKPPSVASASPLLWILTLAIITVAVFIRIRLLDLPLERDEGEYAYTGQLLLQGIAPFQAAYTMKLPGTSVMYALTMLMFGQTTSAIHLGLLFVNLLTAVLLYFLGRRLVGPICGLIAASFYIVLSLSPAVLGLAAHATHFVTLFATAGALLLLRATATRKWLMFFFAGLAMGLAILMKQPGASFALFGAGWVVWTEIRPLPRRWSGALMRLAAFCAGVVLPFGITCLVVAKAGTLGKMWFWTVTYAREYGTAQSIGGGWTLFRLIAPPIFQSAPAMIILGVIGMIIVLAHCRRARPNQFLLAFTAACGAVVFPGLYFRHHYFIPLLAAIALLAGAGIEILCRQTTAARWKKIWPAVGVGAVILAVSHSLYLHRNVFFLLGPNRVGRSIYQANPFPEAVVIGRYIREHSHADDKIAVLGSEPEILFYSHRRSVTGYIYSYELMESQRFADKMRQDMIHEIEAGKPEYVIFVNVPTSWLPRPNSNREIFDWASAYAQTNLLPIGLIDIPVGQETTYTWDAFGVTADPDSKYYIWVFKRILP